ncbi:hypothetical protein GCM10015535_60720 [Streptomyces gelaticus]|uniref:Uncharacterized protein n=1 Tax=Streptomyces gelaticus TaxID=285446 RepID=A0ABQ2W6X0_9ACTN|nr:hypothetical protein GCM10015535_60720 [Streptomyces gelaticus]
MNDAFFAYVSILKRGAGAGCFLGGHHCVPPGGASVAVGADEESGRYGKGGRPKQPCLRGAAMVRVSVLGALVAGRAVPPNGTRGRE